MIELTKNANNKNELKPISSSLVQLKHVVGDSVYLTDPEGSSIEIKTTEDGTQIVFAVDESGKSLAIEHRPNGTRLYHISNDCTGLPSSHEIREDQSEIVYFYNALGVLQHFVELKTNGDRVSTIIGEDSSICSIDQKQIGGIVFQAWLHVNKEPKDGMIWLHPDGEVSTHGDKNVIAELLKKFSRFLDGVRV